MNNSEGDEAATDAAEAAECVVLLRLQGGEHFI